MPDHLTSARKPMTYPIVLPFAFRAATLTGNETLRATASQLQKLDPGGAHRDVTLPNDVGEGHLFWFVNAADAAENLVIKNAAGTTIATVNQNEEAIVIRSGGAWVLVRIATIALS